MFKHIFNMFTGEDLSQEKFEGLCDGFKAHLETLAEDINVLFWNNCFAQQIIN